VVEQFKSVGDVGDVDFQPDAGRALPEPRRLLLLAQARARELVDSLTETDVAFSTQACRGSIAESTHPACGRTPLLLCGQAAQSLSRR
jgi:hypothetical protein